MCWICESSSHHWLCQVPCHHQRRHQKLESHFHWYHFWKRLTAHQGFTFPLSSSMPKWREIADHKKSVFWKLNSSTFRTVCSQLPVVIGWGSFCYGDQAVVLLQNSSKIKERDIYDIVVKADHKTRTPYLSFRSHSYYRFIILFYVFLLPKDSSGCHPFYFLPQKAKIDNHRITC